MLQEADLARNDGDLIVLEVEPVQSLVRRHDQISTKKKKTLDAYAQVTYRCRDFSDAVVLQIQ